MNLITESKIRIISFFIVLAIAINFLFSTRSDLSSHLILSNELILAAFLWFFSRDYEEHWSIYLFSFIYKLSSILIFLFNILINKHGSNIDFAILLINIAIVYLLFGVLNQIYQYYFDSENNEDTQISILKNVKTNNGEKVLELSFQSPVLLVFIRHFGCTFCRETVSDIAKIEDEIKDQGMTPVFVHMSDPSFGDLFFSKYFDINISHISDPNKKIYNSFGLKRAKLTEFLTFKIWRRFFFAGILKKHGLGKIEGDALQLGGVFLIHDGEVVASNIYDTMSAKFSLPKI